MKDWTKAAGGFAMVTQFSLSFMTPLLLCLGVCAWFNTSVGVGSWVFIPGFFFGLGGSATVAYKYYLLLINREKKEKQTQNETKRSAEKKKKVSFNRHV